MLRLESRDDPLFGSSRLLAAWLHSLAAHPLAYLAHRATFMRQFLLRSNVALPIWDWEEADSTYTRNRFFTPVLWLHNALQPTLLFRPGLWLVLSAAICALSLRWRHKPAGACALAVTSCAILYVLSYAVLGVAADFRYAYWCVLAALTGLVALAMAASDSRTARFSGSPAAAAELRVSASARHQ
jgi:hypothetical protein